MLAIPQSTERKALAGSALTFLHDDYSNEFTSLSCALQMAAKAYDGLHALRDGKVEEAVATVREGACVRTVEQRYFDPAAKTFLPPEGNVRAMLERGLADPALKPVFTALNRHVHNLNALQLKSNHAEVERRNVLQYKASLYYAFKLCGKDFDPFRIAPALETLPEAERRSLANGLLPADSETPLGYLHLADMYRGASGLFSR